MCKGGHDEANQNISTMIATSYKAGLMKKDKNFCETFPKEFVGSLNLNDSSKDEIEHLEDMLEDSCKAGVDDSNTGKTNLDRLRKIKKDYMEWLIIVVADKIEKAKK